MSGADQTKREIVRTKRRPHDARGSPNGDQQFASASHLGHLCLAESVEGVCVVLVEVVRGSTRVT